MSSNTRAGTMNVRSLSIAISSDGSSIVVLPPQRIERKPVPTASPYPFSGESTSPSGSDSSSLFYDEDDDVSTSDEESGSEYCPSEDLDDSDVPLVRYTRGCCAPVTRQQALRIRNLHAIALSDQMARLQHAVPHVMYQGASPNLTPQHTVPQTPTGTDHSDDDLEEIYRGYNHITTLDLDQVETLADLQSPAPSQPTGTQQNHGQGNADTADFQFAEPLVQRNWIDPYGLPSDAIDAHLPVRDISLDHRDYYDAFHALANSGHNYLTDFPVVDSPRKGAREISAMLRSERLLEWIPGRSRETMAIGQIVPLPNVKKVNTRAVTFVPFSYTNAWQPRTEAARAAGEDFPVSPRALPPMSPAFGVLFDASK